MKGMGGRSAILVMTIAGMLITVGCTRPESMQVRTGNDPFNEDKDVAFRTTYYFRVFDYCTVKRIVDGTDKKLSLIHI